MVDDPFDLDVIRIEELETKPVELDVREFQELKRKFQQMEFAWPHILKYMQDMELKISSLQNEVENLKSRIQ